MRSPRCALALALAASAVGVARAYKYHFTRGFDAEVPNWIVSEGPMYTIATAPMGHSEPFVMVAMNATVTSMNPYPPPVVGQNATLPTMSIVFVDESNLKTVGYPRPGLADESGQALTLCCTTALFESGLCGAGHEGGPVWFADENIPPPAIFEFKLSYDTPTVFSATYKVQREGEQIAVMLLCEPQARIPSVLTSLDLSFMNPYGWLPGIKYGYLPFFLALMLLYMIFFFGFAIWAWFQRKHLLPLQGAIVAIAVIGLAETTIFFDTYLKRNDNGQPTCCPVTSDVMAGSILNVVKRAVSRLLLAAVCQGFGVVLPRLSRRNSLILFGITAVYLAFGIAAEVASLTAEPGGSPERSLWELPVYVMDVGFAFFIMTGLASIRVQLQQEGQAVKLEMYNQLARVLCSFLAIVCIMAVATIFVEIGVVAFPWKTLWIFTNFWDLLYYIVLVAIAWIWRPGERTAQYSLYQQPSTDENHMMPAADIEMADRAAEPTVRGGGGAGGGGGGGGGGAGGARGGASSQFAISDHADDDDDEDDVEYVLSSSPAKKPATTTVSAAVPARTPGSMPSASRGTPSAIRPPPPPATSLSSAVLVAPSSSSTLNEDAADLGDGHGRAGRRAKEAQD